MDQRSWYATIDQWRPSGLPSGNEGLKPTKPVRTILTRGRLTGDCAVEGVTRGMSKKLFVGGLSWGTTDDGLHGAFSPFGEIVEAKVITDRETGRSRGFGFVTFADDEGATKAIAEMDGTELDGRTIKVNEAEDKPARSGGGGGGRGGYGGGGGGRGGRGGRGGGGGGGRGREEW
jgi:cold-inducible RNA-binding protein